MKHVLDVYGRFQGFVRFLALDPKTGRVIREISRSNTILYGGADVMAKLLAGQPTYKIGGMYLEFQNLADPGDPITPPAFDRDGGRAYYDGLSTSPDRDYLRVPLIGEPGLTASGSAYDDNQATFFAMSEGLAGVHGKDFLPGSNSAVFGAALAAMPDPADQTQDVVFARVYAGIDKILKETGFEIGVSWAVRFL